MLPMRPIRRPRPHCGSSHRAAAAQAGLPELLDNLVKRAQARGHAAARPHLGTHPLGRLRARQHHGSTTQQMTGPATGSRPRLDEIIIDGSRAGSAKQPRPP